MHAVCPKALPELRLTSGQEDEPPTLEVVAATLLLDGLADVDDQQVFHMMKKEGAFPRLVELVRTTSVDEHKELHRLLMQLMYEMSRIQRLSHEELGGISCASSTELDYADDACSGGR